MNPLRQGRIVFVPMLDPQGRNQKTRPAVIVTPTDRITAGGLVRVVAITSLCGEAPREVVVELPWDRNGHPRTKLRRPSEAVCTWSGFYPVDQLTDTGGYVPADRLARVVQIAEANAPAGGAALGSAEPPAGG